MTGFLAATADGSDLADGGKYADLVVAGFDVGSAQKNAIRQGWFYGSVTQDPYSIGYKAVELAGKAVNGEKVGEIDAGATEVAPAFSDNTAQWRDCPKQATGRYR